MVNPTAWAHVPSPGIRTGAQMGIQAIAQGRADELSRQKNMREEKTHGLLNKQQEFELATGIKRQNLVEAGYPMVAALSTDDIEAQNKFIAQAKDVLGGDPAISKGLDHLMAMPPGKERTALLIETIEWLKSQGVYGKEQAKAQAGTAGGGPSKKQKTKVVTIVDDEGNEKLMVGRFNPDTGEFDHKTTPVPEGWKLASELGETAEQTTERKIREAAEKQAQVDKEKGISEVITRGKTAATSIPRIKQSLRLLEQLETGGFEGVKLRAKQFLGVESASEGVLGYNLMRDVLKQLKPVFGSQFTEKEGAWLKDIQPNVNKSTAANKALLKTVLSEYEKQARRALRRAKKRGNWDAVDDIEEDLNLVLEFEDAAQATPVTPEATPSPGKAVDAAKEVNSILDRYRKQ